MTDQTLIEKALELAMRSHDGQTRRGSGRPYIVHPITVGLILARQGFSDTVIAAAIAHDLVEDTDVTSEMLRAELGDAVANLVAAMTHDDALSWDDQKKAYIDAVRAAGDDAKAISIADKIANALSFIAMYEEQGPAVWKHFTGGREKKQWFEQAMLAMLRESWEHPLVEEYAALVDEMTRLA